MTTKKFGEVLRQWRTKRELYLKDVAEKMGWSVVYLSDIERGKRNPPSKEKVLKLAEILGVSAKKLLNPIDKERGFVEFDIKGGSPKKQQTAMSLARKWNNLSEEEIEIIADILKKEKRKDDAR